MSKCLNRFGKCHFSDDLNTVVNGTVVTVPEDPNLTKVKSDSGEQVDNAYLSPVDSRVTTLTDDTVVVDDGVTITDGHVTVTDATADFCKPCYTASKIDRRVTVNTDTRVVVVDKFVQTKTSRGVMIDNR